MIDQGKRNLLGVKVSAVDYGAALLTIMAAARSRQPLAVSALAVHGVMTGVLDPVHRYRLNHLDLAVPDGQPVRWALNLLHKTGLRDRVYRPTLMLKLCEQCAAENLPIYLFGGSLPLLDALQRNLQSRFPQLLIAGKQPSRFRQVTAEEKQDTLAAIQASGAAMVFVGLGCPRQEVWVYEHRGLLKMPLVAVRAAFALHAEWRTQSPAIMQRAGLEWTFRLLQEPRRLWRRYLLLNPLYVLLVMLQAARVAARFDVDKTIAPAHDLRYG